MSGREISSVDDGRVINNTSDVRHNYRVLTDAEKAAMTRLKDLGQAFINACKDLGESRDLSLAITHAEDAVMRAVRHITK